MTMCEVCMQKRQGLYSPKTGDKPRGDDEAAEPLQAAADQIVERIQGVVPKPEDSKVTDEQIDDATVDGAFYPEASADEVREDSYPKDDEVSSKTWFNVPPGQPIPIPVIGGFAKGGIVEGGEKIEPLRGKNVCACGDEDCGPEMFGGVDEEDAKGEPERCECGFIYGQEDDGADDGPVAGIKFFIGNHRVDFVEQAPAFTNLTYTTVARAYADIPLCVDDEGHSFVMSVGTPICLRCGLTR